MSRISLYCTTLFLSGYLLAVAFTTSNPSSTATLLTQFVHGASAKAAHALQSEGKWDLLMMVLFCGWVVITLASWRNAEELTAGRALQQRLLALNHALAEAEVMRDEATIDRILHDDFIFTHPDGRTVGKSDFLRETRGLDLRSQVITHEVARIAGSTAFIDGIGRVRLPSLIEDATTSYRFSAVYTCEHGEWRAVQQRVNRLEPAAALASPGSLHGSANHVSGIPSFG